MCGNEIIKRKRRERKRKKQTQTRKEKQRIRSSHKKIKIEIYRNGLKGTKAHNTFTKAQLQTPSHEERM